MQAYSQDLRDRVLMALERGERPSDIARRLEVSRVWVYQVRNRFQHHGERCSYRNNRSRQSCVAHMEETIRDWIKIEPTLTLTQLCNRLAEQRVQIKPSALWHQLNKWELSFKKRTTQQEAKTKKRLAE